MPRHSSAERLDAVPASPASPRLYDAGEVDLVTMRLVLEQHLADLRSRGVPEDVLRPIEADLRHYEDPGPITG